MNYPIRDGLIGYLLNTIKVDKFSEMLNRQLSQYARENIYAMYNTLGSHDTVRIKTELGGDNKKMKMAFGFLMAFPGAPAIYYGDEIGLDGGKDPDCRKAFPWNEKEWDQDLRTYIQQLINIRNKKPVLRRGSYQEVLADVKRSGYAFMRNLGEDSVLSILNASGTRRNYRLSVAETGWEDGRIVNDLLSNQEFIVSGSDLNISIDPWSILWIN
jgi:glycosidase